MKRHGKGRPGWQLLVLAVLWGILLTACQGQETASVNVSVEGGILLEQGLDQVMIRAVSPEVMVRLEGSAAQPQTFQVTVNNVRSGNTLVSEVGDLRQQTTVASEHLSPTQISFQVELNDQPRQYQVFWQPEPRDQGYTVALVGDNQGNDDVLADIIEEVNQSEALFLLHLGDLVPSGQAQEYERFLAVMEGLNIPWYAVPGNHDVRGEGTLLFQQLIGPLNHDFQLGDFRFVLLDTSGLGISEEQLEWLEEALIKKDPPDIRNVVLTHAPPRDPRGHNHALLTPSTAESFLQLMKVPGARVAGLFSGHVHMFYHEVLEGVHHVISGGAGARLYAAEQEGGFHHYTLVRLGESLEVAAYPVAAPPRSTDLVVTGPGGDLVLTQEELMEMVTIQRQGKFQNVHGNFRSQGVYQGVLLSQLVELVGGMVPGDQLRVHSWDGYQQVFAYENVYPEAAGWYPYQGDMVLALTYNGKGVPDWDEGYRIAFLPEDGVYDNHDLMKTSLPGMGGHVYPSAGSQWVRMVNRVEVVPWNRQDP